MSTKLKFKTMKKILLLTSALSLAFASFSQDALVKVSPFHFVDGTIYSTYERALSNNNSFTLSGGYNLTENGDEYGWMGELQLRKYVFKPAINNSSDSPLSGVYAGLYGNGKYFVQQYDRYITSWEIEPYQKPNYDENGNYIGSTYIDGIGYSSVKKTDEYEVKQMEGGIVMGFQMIFSNNLSLDFFVGGGLRSSVIENKPKEIEFYAPERGYTGIVPKIGFDVGISF